ncbi:hypothetical protein Poli38472_006149 [Pythium oligandrum]|uniref:Cyclic nucleotide-binding domain-containing protein n=1 Tax=Pythium oligandrum TaxID=41045 RepID=A0A8K1CU57_PYTOL|nr:hypothetical protein Poli38472_006149 [Pythium oligandrum]|eukprot:TMW68681.1 hypothetical protein Poli38472_006149 [Pythium oligandrum]
MLDMATDLIIQTMEEVEGPNAEVRANLRRILLLSDLARCRADYEYLDKYVHSVSYFADLPPRDRLKYLRAVRGIELNKGEELFHIGDPADAFFCIMYGTLNVVVDFAHMSAPTMNEFDEVVNRARIHSTFLNPGTTIDVVQATSYVVRCMKPLECFGDVGLLTTDQVRTASVVASEKSLCMKIDRETYLDLRKSNSDQELREKIKFIIQMVAFEHWDGDSILRLTGRMERLNFSYNDVVIKEGDPAGYVFFVKHGECRLVKRYPMLRVNKQACFAEIGAISSRSYFGVYEVITGAANAQFSVLVSSPTAILYRMDRVDFRQTVLKDSITEQHMRSECADLTPRIDPDNVRRDLELDLRWTQYKREAVTDVLVKHQREYASPSFGSRSPRPFHIVDSQPSSTGATSPLSPRRPPRVTQAVMRSSPRMNGASSPKKHRNDSKWLEWAKQRARDIINDHGRLPSDSGSQELKSNIQWGKSSKIMGGFDDNDTKITSAIVSLFNPKEGKV